ncbi:MAG: deoxynucleoside kinase [Leptolinea sp.]
MYIAVEGVIGVGKTTLARLLQPIFNAGLLLEVFEENPFLGDFYCDRARYAFQTQIFFLLSRYRQQNSNVPRLLGENKSLISDYTFEKDTIFASINLQGDELEMYHRVHEALAEKVASPNLLIYLRASMDTIMQRIALRDRPYERQIERAYLEQLSDAYEEFLSHPARLPFSTLIIDTDNSDYLNSAEELKSIGNRIRQALQLRPFQPTLPIAPSF